MVFYDRCAYCERLISGYYGDAEPFKSFQISEFSLNLNGVSRFPSIHFSKDTGC